MYRGCAYLNPPIGCNRLCNCALVRCTVMQLYVVRLYDCTVAGKGLPIPAGRITGSD